jgi:parallel beta-helix repeat protein
MLRRDVPRALLISAAAGAVAVTDKAVAQTCTAPCYALTQAEMNAGVTSTNANLEYLQGDVRRYGTDPTGSADSTAALIRAIATGYSLYFCDGVFLTSGNLSPLGKTTWWGTGTLKGSGTANTLVTIGAISHFTFAINTDCTLQTPVTKIAISASGASDFSIQDGQHIQGAIEVGSAAGCSNFAIANNVLLSTVGNHLPSQGAINLNATCTYFEVTNNRITGSTGAGITIFNRANQGLVANNVCTGCVAGSGICIDSAFYLTIQGNICSGNGQVGIELSPSNPSTYGYVSLCTITANICEKNVFDGIDYNLANAGTSQPTFTTISGNVLANNGSAANGGTGIYLAFADETTVSGNTMVGNNQPGIFLNNSNYCTVSGNNVIANGTNSANTIDGICVYNSTFNSITGNNSTNNGGAPTQRYGISETVGVASTTSNYNCIAGNNLNNNVSGPVNIHGGNTIVQGNMPLNYDKMFYSNIYSSFLTPNTTGVPNGSLWMNPGNGRLYVLQSGTWTEK